MDKKLAAVLVRGRNAMNRMAGAMTDDDYIDAAAQLGDAFRDLDQLLTDKAA